MNITIPNRAALIATAILLASCHRAADRPEPDGTPVRVLVVRDSEVVDEVIASGSVEAIDKAEVAFLVPGRVTTVEAEDGALVAKNQVLARLDPGDFEKSVAIADAQLQEVTSRHGRLSRLHDAGSLTETDFDKINSARQQAEAAAELARRQLAYTVLRAPFDGWLVKRGIAPGLVAMPAVPVFTVVAPGAVWANLGVAEADIAKIHVGQSVAVSVAAVPTQQTGTVDAVLPNADVLSRAFTVKVRLENQGGEFRHGNVVVGHIRTGKRRLVIALPPQVIQRFPDGSLFVWVVDPVRQVAVRQLVHVGSLGSTGVEVAAGLRAGDQVVLNVPHTLFEGARVAVATAP